MIGLVKRYRSMSFEERTIFNARFSILFNFILAIGKLFLGFFANAIFFVTSAINLFMMLSRFECYLGVMHPKRKTFRFRNNLVGTFLTLAGLQYTTYMIILMATQFESRNYSMFLGITIAFVSFVELGVAIKGCFNAYGKGHYYRNIKMINLCSALTAIALTEVAIMSFAGERQTESLDYWFGIGVGSIIILMGIYVFIAPKISIVDCKHNIYTMTEDSDLFTEKQFSFKLTHSKLYGNYFFEGSIQGGIVDGMIIEEKNPIYKWNIFAKILIIILSEILIFPYALGALVYHFKNANLIKNLDKLMLQHGCIKIEEGEAYENGEDIIG